MVVEEGGDNVAKDGGVVREAVSLSDTYRGRERGRVVQQQEPHEQREEPREERLHRKQNSTPLGAEHPLAEPLVSAASLDVCTL